MLLVIMLNVIILARFGITKELETRKNSKHSSKLVMEGVCTYLGRGAQFYIKTSHNFFPAAPGKPCNKTHCASQQKIKGVHMLGGGAQSSGINRELK